MRKILSYITLMILVFASCKKSEDLSKPILGLEGDTWETTPLDQWLKTNFTSTYNMNIKYRWDATEYGVQYTLVPPDTAKVRAIMTVVKQAWIDLYAAEVSETFVKKYGPKEYQLVGSLRYNGSTVTLGEAEGGSTVRLFNVNAFSLTDREKVKRVLKTIHHEFAHILHQTINFPYVDYQSITKSGYIGTWNQTSVAEAREEGFITNYAKASPNEDFVEMTSIMITEGRVGYEAIVSSIASAEAKAAIRAKQDIIVSYFKQVWNIDIFSMMDRCQAALDAIVPPPPPPPLHSQLGSGKIYSTVKVDTLVLSGLSRTFLDAYKAGSLQLGTLGNAGRFIEFLTFYFDAPDKLRLRIQYRNPSNLTSVFNADFAYDMSISNDGVVTLTYVGPPAEAVTVNNNARTIEPYVTSLTQGYLQGQFQLDWPGGVPASSPPVLGGFYRVGNADDYFFGELGN
jgi:substrate import-associated zinc metallohydrolase lipoprotein